MFSKFVAVYLFSTKGVGYVYAVMYWCYGFTMPMGKCKQVKLIETKINNYHGRVISVSLKFVKAGV